MTMPLGARSLPPNPSSRAVPWSRSPRDALPCRRELCPFKSVRNQQEARSRQESRRGRHRGNRLDRVPPQNGLVNVLITSLEFRPQLLLACFDFRSHFPKPFRLCPRFELREQFVLFLFD